MLQKYFTLKIISNKEKNLRTGTRYAKAVILDMSVCQKVWYFTLFYAVHIFQGFLLIMH